MMLDDLYSLWLTHNKRVDPSSMAASIEARVPYQDTYVVEIPKVVMELKLI